MNATEKRTLTWHGGPTFVLDRTALRVEASERTVGRIVEKFPAWKRHPWLVRNVWRRRFTGPHPLTRSNLVFDGERLAFNTPNGWVVIWRVPEGAAAAVWEFIADLNERRKRREQHRLIAGRGRSLIPAVALIAIIVWFIRRVRGRR